MEKKKKIILGIGISIFLILLALGSTYAYWMITKEQENENIVSTGCFQIEFLEEESISLMNAYPVSDEKGLTNKPYTFKLVNVCDSLASYQINLETMSQTGNVKVLPDKYLKAGIQEETKRPFITKLNPTIEVEPIIDGATTAYKLLTGTLKQNETKTFHLRLWMDSETLAVEESMNASYKGRVSITTSYKEDQVAEGGTLMVRDGTSAFWAYCEYITKVVFESSMIPHETSEDLIFDVSDKQDKSVMSYLVPNEEDTTKYTLYIQSNGRIKANSDCSYLFAHFSNVTDIQGLEYFDTSNVTDLSSMFYECNSLTSLDVNFSTSNVTSMSDMFSGCSSLMSLDLSSFDTSNVKNMSLMFYGCSSLTSLDVSHFDTSNVTSMAYMFENCNSLTSLDLSSFGTSNVTDMSAMFYECNSLTSLDVSSFDTSNVTDMSAMFYECNNLISLDVSSFDTSNVTDMSEMFSSCSSLTSLDLSHFDTSNVIHMLSMFHNDVLLSNIVYGEKFIYANDADIREMFSDCPANKPTHESWNEKF